MEGKGTTKFIAKVLTRVLMIGFGVQIILGAAWACLQFPRLQEFGETYFLLKVRENLVCDEYVGILYPILLRIFWGIAKVIPIPYYCYLYALQLAVAALAARFFLNSFPSFKDLGMPYKTWAILSLMTIPLAMQCHMAVLPYSLTGSLFLTQLGLVIRGFLSWRDTADGSEKSKGPAIRIALMGACWLAEELLLPEYRTFGGVLTAGYGIAETLHCKVGRYDSKKGLHEMLRIVLITAVLLGAVPQVSRLTTTPGSHGRMGNSPEAAAMRRYAWDDFGELYGDWPEELKSALTQEEISVCNEYPERKTYILGEKVDAAYGREKAREIYGAVARAGKKIRARRNLKEMLQDAASYGFSPLAQVILMTGKAKPSHNANNYEVMRMGAPRLTSLYVRFGGFLYAVALFVCLVFYAGIFIRAEGKKRLWILGNGFIMAIMGIFMVLYYVHEGGGIMDPKNALVITLLWASWACVTASRGLVGAEK